MPLLFVFFCSTGFVAAKLGLPHIEPMTFLSVRFALVVALMLPVTLVWCALYLVPPATAIEAYFLFHETLTAMAMVGMVFVIVGVALVTARTQGCRTVASSWMLRLWASARC